MDQSGRGKSGTVGAMLPCDVIQRHVPGVSIRIGCGGLPQRDRARDCETAAMDKTPRSPHLRPMRRFPLWLLLMFVAVFAAGSVFATASSATMALDMAMVSDADMAMDGCDACPASDVKQSHAECDMDCTVPAAAILFDGAVLAVPLATVPLPRKGLAPAGRAGPPDRSPPRTSILS